MPASDWMSVTTQHTCRDSMATLGQKDAASNLHVFHFLQHLKIQHVLDVMHCKKNLYENILKTLFGMNDSLGSHQDVEDLNICQEIWMQPPR